MLLQFFMYILELFCTRKFVLVCLGRGKKEYSGFLKDLMDESDELSTKAQVLLQRINDYSIPEKKDLEPMVKIVFSEYREMETGKYLSLQ